VDDGRRVCVGGLFVDGGALLGGRDGLVLVGGGVVLLPVNMPSPIGSLMGR
jgi:hypothetical protein